LEVRLDGTGVSEDGERRIDNPPQIHNLPHTAASHKRDGEEDVRASLGCTRRSLMPQGRGHRRSPSLPDFCQGLAVWVAAVVAVAGWRAAVWSAAASAATATRSGGGSGGCRRWKNSSMKPVCRWAARNSGSSRIWRKKARLVWMPPTSYSRRARIVRAVAWSRVSSQTASLASRGSYSMGTVQPS